MKKRTTQRHRKEITKQEDRNRSRTTRYYLSAGVVLAILALALAFGRSRTMQHAEAASSTAVAPMAESAPGPSSMPGAMTPSTKESLPDGMVFNDYPAQMREFIGYNDSIHLTADQEAIKDKALGSHPAVCCHDSSALTCCCPCNLSRSVWGLTNYLIAKKGYGVKQVENAVAEWMAFTNPSGYTGDACYVPGGCERAPRQDGCGGMDANNLVL